MMKKGQAMSGVVGGVVLAIVGLILMIGVLVPITTNVTGSQGFTGINLTLANNLVTFILIGVLLLIIGVVFVRWEK